MHPLRPSSHTWQERFVKYAEKTVTTMETNKNKVAEGWYSEEDMKVVLKWNKYLRYQSGVLNPFSSWFGNDMNQLCHVFRALRGLRKKIDGAVKICLQDKTLVRPGSSS